MQYIHIQTNTVIEPLSPRWGCWWHRRTWTPGTQLAGRAPLFTLLQVKCRLTILWVDSIAVSLFVDRETAMLCNRGVREVGQYGTKKPPTSEMRFWILFIGVHSWKISSKDFPLFRIWSKRGRGDSAECRGQCPCERWRWLMFNYLFYFSTFLNPFPKELLFLVLHLFDIYWHIYVFVVF